MIVKTREQFYKDDKKEYIVTRNKSFMFWFYNKLKKGYQSYLRLNEIEFLIVYITSWYQKYYDPDYCDISDLSIFEQLREKLFSNQLKTFDVEYRTNVKDSKEYINFTLIDKDTNANYLISANTKDGIISNKMQSSLTLEELYSLLITKENFDLSELKQILFTYNIDFELRKKIINFINLALIYSPNTTLERGYEIALKFSEDMKNYYGIEVITPSIEHLSNINNKRVVKSNVDEKVLLKKIQRLQRRSSEQ